MFARLLLAPLLLLTACSTTPNVRSQPAQNFDLAAYRSFHLQPIATERVDPGFVLRNGGTIEEAIRRGMTLRGIDAAEESDADLLVTVRVRVTERLSGNSGPRVGFGVGSSSYGSGVGTSIGVSTGSSARTETTGRLTVELRDRESDELVWVGWAEGRPRKDSEQRIEETIDAILGELPGAAPTARLQPAGPETQEKLRKRRDLSRTARRL